MSGPVDCDSSDNPCGGGGGGGGQNNAWLIQQQQAAAAAQAAAEEAARQAELALQQEQAAQKRRQDEEQRQADFIRNRDQAAGTLKGPVGTPSLLGASGDPQLKGFMDTGIKDLQPDRQTRDLGGRHAAWKQLHCAASIAFDAVSALQTSLNDPQHDTSEFKYLSGEASKALNGESLGVQCPAAPPFPTVQGKPINPDQGKAAEKRILERANRIADRIAKEHPGLQLQTSPEKISAAGADDDLAKLRATQAELNKNQRRKYDPNNPEAIRREQREKKETAKLIIDAQKVEKGDFSISLDESPPAKKASEGAR